jgi:hypothetical protein
MRRTLVFLCIGAASAVSPTVDLAGRSSQVVRRMPTPYLRISAQPLPGFSAGATQVALELAPETLNQEIYVTLGTHEYASLCGVNSGVVRVNGPESEGPPPGALIDWRFQARLKSSTPARAEIELNWKRTVKNRTAVDADTIERQYQLSLSERSREVIDIVRPPEGTSSDCEGFAIEAEFFYRDEPDLENSLLQYDVWLIDTDASGEQMTDHLEPRGLQGRDVEYAFRPQRFDVDGKRSPAGPVSSRLEGRVKGRVRSDGRIDLAVGVMRWVQSGSLGTGDGGGKLVTVSDGETIEVLTPRLFGDLPGVPNDSNLFRAGHTSIRVTVRRIS